MATTATYGTLSASEHSANLRKAVIASTIGTTIEWYDFFIYGTAERNNATQGRSEEFRATSRAAPQHGAAIVGNRLASLQRDSGHHRQAQRGRHEHRAALASKPAAAFRVRPVPRSGAPMYLAFVRPRQGIPRLRPSGWSLRPRHGGRPCEGSVKSSKRVFAHSRIVLVSGAA
jgi:hypothetical protein